MSLYCTSNDKFSFVHAENILKPYYSFIYELLDFDKMYLHLCRENLLSTKEQNEITKHELTREEKITKILDIVVLRGLDTQREFIDLVGRSAREDAKQKKLHKILLNRTTPYKGSIYTMHDYCI